MPFPYVNETIQASILSLTSNILAQAISAYQEDRSFALETTPIVQFVTYAILNTPLNCAWQEWLEDNFPGSTSPDPASSHPAGSNAYNERKTDEKAASEQIRDKTIAKKSTLSVRNTAIKFGLDQTIGAAFNTILFVAGIGAMKRLGWDEIVSSIKNDSMPIYWAGAKLWPAVSLISFTLVPVERRVVFGSIVGVAWGIFLSLQAAK